MPHYRIALLLTGLVLGIHAFGQQPAEPATPNDPATAQANAAQPQPASQPQPAAQAETAALPQAPSAQSQKTAEEAERDIQKKEQSQRMFGVVPMFAVTDRHNAPPLTSSEKFHLMAKTLVDPFFWGIAFVQAGIEQANNSFAGYGQGMQGYAKRYGAYVADSADSNFWANYAYPVLFKQDPRYFRLGTGSFGRRMLYAMAQEFVAHQDSGRRMFHFSNVLGAFTSGTISNAYYPQEDRGVGLTCNRAAVSLAYGALGNIGIEFWPDIDRKLHHKKASQMPPPPKAEDSPK